MNTRNFHFLFWKGPDFVSQFCCSTQCLLKFFTTVISKISSLGVSMGQTFARLRHFLEVPPSDTLRASVDAIHAFNTSLLPSIDQSMPVHLPCFKIPVIKISPPNNFDTALANIKTAGIVEPLSDREQQALRVLLNDFCWKASSPHRANDSRFAVFQARWSTLPGLYPILDAFGWPELTPPGADYHLVIDSPLDDMWMLFGRPDGYFFYYGEFRMLFPVGKSLEIFLRGLEDLKFYDSVEEGGWKDIPEDNRDW
jgi:hypothetical protein